MTSPYTGHPRTFPRGLVLGLTMAETAILIIFVLLLALTALIGRETDRRRDAENRLERFEEIQSVLTERGLEPEGILDTIRNHAADRSDAHNWRELVRDLDTRIPDPSPKTIVSQLDEAREAVDVHRALDEILDEVGTESTIEKLREMVEIVGREADLTSPQTVQNLVRDAERWRDYAGDAEDAGPDVERASQRIEALEARVERLQTQVQGGGGTDHPSCWYDDDNTVAYLFDVALTEAGYLLQPARAPQHERKRASLQDELTPIRTGHVLGPARFREQTRPVYEWSVANGCRFFVRAFDLTAADQKEVYKDRMRTLESHFYKNASPSGPPPSVDPGPMRP